MQLPALNISKPTYKLMKQQGECVLFIKEDNKINLIGKTDNLIQAIKLYKRKTKQHDVAKEFRAIKNPDVIKYYKSLLPKTYPKNAFAIIKQGEHWYIIHNQPILNVGETLWYRAIFLKCVSVEPIDKDKLHLLPLNYTPYLRDDLTKLGKEHAKG